MGAANRLADATALTVGAGATFNLNNFDETIGSLAGAGNVTLGAGTLTTGGDNSSTTFSGVVSGTGGLTKTGTGTLTVSGNNTYTGTTTINGGTLQLGAANRLADATALTVGAGATFNLNNFDETIGSLAGAGNVMLGTGTLTAGGDNSSTTFSGIISGSGGLTKAGTGTLTVSGNNTYTGATTINGGTLQLGAAARLADATALTVGAGATFNLNNFDETIGSLAGAGNVTLGTGTLTAGGDNSSTTFSGIISGSGGLTKAGTGTLTLSGNNTYTGTTTINGGTLQLGAAARLADATALTVGAGATFNLNNFDETIGSLAGAGNVTLGTGTLTAGGDNSSTTFSGVVSGTGGLTKTGTGTLTLSGNNTYTGATTINGGTLQLGAAARLADATALTVGAGATFNLNNFDETIGSLAGAGNVTLGTGTLTAGGDNSSTTFSGVVSGTGGLTKTGTGTLTLSGNNTYTGATTINGGTLQLGAANRLADATAVTVGAGATFNLNNFDETVGSLVGPGNVTLGTGTLTAGGDNSSTTFSGVVSGSGGLTKAGTGTLTVSGNNTYTGATTINGGTLQLGAANRLADATALTVGAGATFNLNNFDETVGSLAGAGNVTLGTGTLTAGGDNSSTTFSGVVSGSGGLTKAGTGTLTLSGNNTYTGATTINGGTLQLGAAGRLADATALTVGAGATFDLNNFDETIGSLAGAGNVTLGTGTLTAGGDNSSTTFSGVVSGSGGLTKAGTGTLTLSGNNTYTGATTINGGTLQLGAAARLADATALTVGAGATFNLNNFDETIGSLAGAGNVTLGTGTLTAGGDNSSTTFSGVVSGTGGLTKTGTGTLTLSGNNTYTGGTTLQSGGLALNGTLASAVAVNGGTLSGTGTVTGNLNNTGGTVSPGPGIGTLTVNGNFVQGAGGTLGVALNAAGQSGLLNVTGTSTLNGLVNLQPQPGNYVDGTIYTILSSAGGVTGTLNLNAGNLLTAGLVLRLLHGATAVQVQISQSSFQRLVTSGYAAIVARYLDSVRDRATGDTKNVINQLAVLDSTNIVGALNQVHIEAMQTLAEVNALENTIYMTMLSERLHRVDRIRYLAPQSGLSGRSNNQASLPGTPGGYGNPIYVSFSEPLAQQLIQYQDLAPMSVDQDGYSVWMNGFGQLYDQDTEVTSGGTIGPHTGYRATTGGVSFGVDSRTNSRVIVGTAVGLSGGEITFNENRGKIDVYGIRADVYASTGTPQYFVEGSLGV